MNLKTSPCTCDRCKYACVYVAMRAHSTRTERKSFAFVQLTFTEGISSIIVWNCRCSAEMPLTTTFVLLWRADKKRQRPKHTRSLTHTHTRTLAQSTLLVDSLSLFVWQMEIGKVRVATIVLNELN